MLVGWRPLPVLLVRLLLLRLLLLPLQVWLLLWLPLWRVLLLRLLLRRRLGVALGCTIRWSTVRLHLRLHRSTVRCSLPAVGRGLRRGHAVALRGAVWRWVGLPLHSRRRRGCGGTVLLLRLHIRRLLVRLSVAAAGGGWATGSRGGSVLGLWCIGLRRILLRRCILRRWRLLAVRRVLGSLLRRVGRSRLIVGGLGVHVRCGRGWALLLR
mmetsp:Transcript_8280/g.24786  ORF Transcript_8280/g.24786 Transcript_8280/m.24786 type:complete len:211 (+) Transcript_8280:1405-2037(+)